MSHYDIIIVGAGPVGICLALALAPLPLRIAILEANPVNVQEISASDTRALALTYNSINILKKINLWPALQQHATPIEMVHISDRGHFGITRIKAEEERVPALGYVIPASFLSNELNKALLQLDKITLLNPARVKTLAYDASQWQLEIISGQKIQTITAELVIAADGTRSTIRELLGIDVQEKDYQQSALTTTITLAQAHANVAYERFLANGALAMLPLHDSQVGCVWTAPTSIITELMSHSDQDFLARLQQEFGFRLGPFLKIGKRHTHPLKMIYAVDPIKPGLLLIGNAAHTLHPIAAQGFNLGLSDAAELAQLLEKTLRAEKNINDPNLLKTYLAQRKPRTEWIMQFTHALTRLFTQDFLPLTLARNSCLFALDFIPPIKHRLAERLMGR